MADKGVKPATVQPDHRLPSDAGLEMVLQYTDWFVAGTGDTEEHFRYSRYSQTLRHLAPSTRRQVHVDIGCGAGLFSWVFLDGAVAQNVSLERVRLFGLDRNRASLALAKRIREKLLAKVPSYPKLNYYRKPEILSRELRKRQIKGSDYVITFGHVLVQSHSPKEIQQFSEIIETVVEILERGCSCTLVAVDARREEERRQLSQGWDLLLSRLGNLDLRIKHVTFGWNDAHFVGPDDRKMTILYPLS